MIKSYIGLFITIVLDGFTVNVLWYYYQLFYIYYKAKKYKWEKILEDGYTEIPVTNKESKLH